MKRCNQRLELLTDINMHLLIERGIRGGISIITQRWTCANNPSVPNQDTDKPSYYIIYLDANNLYWLVMSEPLPYGDFQWINPNIITNWIQSLDENGEYGYVLEVDLEYPLHLHDYHNDYTLAPEKDQD